VKKTKRKRLPKMNRERIEYWRNLGLVVDPVSERQGYAGNEAKKWVDGFVTHKQVRQMLAAGRSVKDVARYSGGMITSYNPLQR